MTTLLWLFTPVPAFAVLTEELSLRAEEFTIRTRRRPL
jgi:hypothetical protein